MFPIWELSGVKRYSAFYSTIMKIIGLPILNEFGDGHRDCIQQINAWLAEVQVAEWSTPSDIRARYINASILPDNRAVFNIKGNKYRLDVKIYYQRQIVIVKRVGTHEQYEGWRF